MLLRTLLAAIVALAATASFATPQPRNATDIWFNAAESGWGLNLVHQGDTLFGTLFVYGPDGQPTWYVASNLSGNGVYTGPLYAATGTWFGASRFDAATVTRRQVGTMSVDVRNGSALVDYTVDGVHVTKQVTRFSFRGTNLTGVHKGFEYQPAANGLPEVRHELEFARITDDGAVFRMETSSDGESSCAYTGTRGQDGQMETVSGTYTCGSGSGARSGNWSMRVDQTPTGFVGAFTGNGITSPSGRIAVSLHAAPKMEGTGWRNGMWFVPGEDGWGVNIVEQGDTIFATLYVYDAQGKPHWYVASQLTQSGATADGTATNSGALFEATGPWFGASSFNPAAVNRRAVGTMSFQLRGPGSAALTYSVDGVTVTKNIVPFTFRRNDPSGVYRGYIADPSDGWDPARIAITDSGGSFSMRIGGMYGGTCDYTGSSQQVNDAVNASGTVQCGPGASATFTLKNLIVEGDGITGRLELANVTGFVQDGERTMHISGAREN